MKQGSKSVLVTIRFNEDLAEAASEVAEKLGVSRGSLVRLLLLREMKTLIESGFIIKSPEYTEKLKKITFPRSWPL